MMSLRKMCQPILTTSVPVKGYQADTVHKVTLERYLNENWSRMIPVFEGKNVRMLYDNIVNYAD